LISSHYEGRGVLDRPVKPGDVDLRTVEFSHQLPISEGASSF
jgi:hypothetical protein